MPRNRTCEKQCMECGTLFLSHFGEDSSDFCSPTCGNFHYDDLVNNLSKALRQKQAWRYVEINTYLNDQSVPHEFEFPLGNYLFDLALPNEGILIEFDEPYHSGVVQSTKDLEKDSYAEQKKWVVFRIPVQSNTVIPIDSIQGIIETYC